MFTMKTTQSFASRIMRGALSTALLFASFVLTAGIGSQIVSAQAQSANEKGSPEQIADRRTTHLTKHLKLTTDQAGKIKPIILQSAMDVKKLRTEKKSDTTGVYESVRTTLASADTSIRAILTPEQQTKFDAMRTKAKAKMDAKMEERKEKKMQSK
jgi:periplasmic protein CpxP/Spy